MAMALAFVSAVIRHHVHPGGLTGPAHGHVGELPAPAAGVSVPPDAGDPCEPYTVVGVPSANYQLWRRELAHRLSWGPDRFY